MPRCLLLFEPPDGGVAENVLRIALGLRNHGWEPWVVGPREAIIYSELEHACVPIARLPLVRGYGSPARDSGALRRLLGIMVRHDFDLLHAHSAKAGVLGRIAARSARLPAVYSPHCFPFVGPWGIGRRVFSTGVERALGSSTAAIVCVCEQERTLASERRLTSPDRLHVVYNGCEACQRDLERDRSLAEFAAGGPLAACITVLRPQKSVHVFLQAAPEILARVPDARLAVVGDGELRGELEALAVRLELGPRLRFFEFEPPMSRQLAEVDVFVLPSAWEAFPIALLEAMACGVPQVATDVGGTREAVSQGETGLLVPPNDPAALADRVVGLLRNPARRERMAAASRIRHCERFALGRMIAETADVYDQVLSTRARGLAAR
jgi:glycosyltransferase involved in cell wall biosynthesis